MNDLAKEYPSYGYDSPTPGRRTNTPAGPHDRGDYPAVSNPGPLFAPPARRGITGDRHRLAPGRWPGGHDLGRGAADLAGAWLGRARHAVGRICGPAGRRRAPGDRTR